MGIFIVKAKVRQMSEEYMEQEANDIPLDFSKCVKWLWKKTAILANNVYRIEEYTPTKTLIMEEDGTKTLVAEPFETVFNKWQSSYEEDLELGFPEEENNEEGENNSQEEEE